MKLFLVLASLIAVSANTSYCDQLKTNYGDCCTDYVANTCDGPRQAYQTAGCCNNPEATAPPPSPPPAVTYSLRFPDVKAPNGCSYQSFDNVELNAPSVVNPGEFAEDCAKRCTANATCVGYEVMTWAAGSMFCFLHEEGANFQPRVIADCVYPECESNKLSVSGCMKKNTDATPPNPE